MADGKVVIDLIDAIKPGSINYDLVLPGNNDEVSEIRHNDYIYVVFVKLQNDVFFKHDIVKVHDTTPRYLTCL